jgi:hypothetical protein
LSSNDETILNKSVVVAKQTGHVSMDTHNTIMPWWLQNGIRQPHWTKHCTKHFNTILEFYSRLRYELICIG